MRMNEVRQLLTRLSLPEAYLGFVSLYLKPVANILDTRIRRGGKCPLIGINGSQGSGKSTAAQFLKHLLETGYGHRIAVLSIDDFYHSRSSREAMASKLHPLFVTRGVPGTHDIDLAMNTIHALKDAVEGQCIAVPRFDKASDDRKPPADWESIEGPVSAIILEGWCIGAPPLSDAELPDPINDLERNEDPHGLWRRTYSAHLAAEYQKLFAGIDWLLMLKAPSFDVVFAWRQLQEKKLAEISPDSDALLNEQQLQRFIQHYQRLTEHCLQHIPEQADAVIALDDQHRMTGLELRHA